MGYSYDANISQSYSNNEFISGANYIGGLVGWAYSTIINNTYSRSNVYSTGQFVGGLVGLLGSEFMGSIYNSYATGNVEGLYSIGGLVGGISTDDIHNSFSTGNISLLESGAWVGGVFGDYQGDFVIDNVYWYNSSYNSDLNCYSDGECENATAVSDLTYFYNFNNSPINQWDFNNTWVENNNTYPTLKSISYSLVSNSTNNNSSEDNLEEEEDSSRSSGASYSSRTYYSDSLFTSEGNTFGLWSSEKVKFSVNSINHTLTLVRFNSTSAKVKIQSEPIVAYLEKDVLYKFDLDNDSISDLLVKYNGVNSSRKANLFIQEIVFSENESSNQTLEEFEKDSSLEVKSKSNIWFKVILLVIFAILSFLYFKLYPVYRRYKRKKEEGRR